MQSATPVLEQAAPAQPHVPPGAEENRLRLDIQALRGVAILLVVAYHSRLLPALEAGYLGVDVFFVVSGFLITGIIRRGIEAGTFRCSDFYLRRARRLLPAAYATLALTLFLSMFFLTQSEARDFTWQVLGTLTFTGNIVLWMQTGYFEGAAQLKPLLHVWSLAIEEQYYLLLPATLLLVPRRYWLGLALLAFCASLALCLAVVASKPGATFYLLPTRAWELALGSIGALLPVRYGLVMRRKWLLLPAVAALVVIPFHPTGTAHPGLDALMVCAATLVIILARRDGLEGNLVVRGLAYVGDISYSLYLIHWPLLAFAATAWMTPVPGAVRLSLVLLSFVLALAMYRWIERPMRSAPQWSQGRQALIALGASAAVAVASLGLLQWQLGRSSMDFDHLRRPNVGFATECDYGNTYTQLAKCQSGATPTTMVWGDSYAMHLVPGLDQGTTGGIIQATRSSCGPLRGISMFRSTGFYNRTWAEGCIRFNEDVLRRLADSPHIDVVVLSTLMGQYLGGGDVLVSAAEQASGATPAYSVVAATEALALGSLADTITAIRALGKRVVLISPPPAAGFNVGRCLEMKLTGKFFLGAPNRECSIPAPAYARYRDKINSALDKVAKDTSAPLIRLGDFLCDDSQCVTELDGHLLYRDEGHLSNEGSVAIARRLGLFDRAVEIAR